MRCCCDTGCRQRLEDWGGLFEKGLRIIGKGNLIYEGQQRTVLERALRLKLRSFITGDVLFDEPLSPYTSFGVGGKADALIFPETTGELSRTMQFLSEEGV